MDWESLPMSSLQLTDTEHRYYGDVFIYCCENADTDYVPSSKVGQLLRSANLPCHVTLAILDICDPAKSNILSRKQFYAILKLVAAHQAGLEIHTDLITASVDELTLPRFKWPSSMVEEELDNSRHFSKINTNIRLSSHMPESTTESESEAESPRETEGGSTESPTPTNSVTQERDDKVLRGEANLDSIPGGWQSLLISEEQRQLLGTEEESSERHSSDDGEGEDDSFPPEEVWTITDEQREYYAAHFSTLQANPDGLVTGSVARRFFEKSRLPIEELRRIWQLSDVTRDSALSLNEFYVAMHLVVLRRNHIPLPDVLPPALSMLVQPPSQPPQQPPPPPIIPPVPAPRTTSPATRAAQAAAAVAKDKSKEWTKFVDSPTGTSGNTSNNSNNGGSITSPGPKPCNFDFQKSAVERDPKILHPVPLRLTPEAAILASNANGNNGVSSILASGDDELSLAASLGVQRPVAKKPGIPIPDETVIAPKKEPPPPPPPRPYRTHTRSSSLDLNKLGKNGQNFLGAPPTVPPRVSPGITSSTTTRKLVGQKSEGEGSKFLNDEQGFVADFSQFASKDREIQTVENNVPPAQQFTGVCGAFHIYKKPSPKKEDEATKDDSDGGNRTLTLQELREKNSELRQVCEELTRELAGALQERINLRAKLLLLT